MFVKSHLSLQKRLEAEQWQSSLLGVSDCSLYFGVIGKFSFISNTILVFQDSRDSLILVFLPLAFNSLCLPLVKITKSCKKLENFLSLPANSLGCHDLMELAGDWRFLGYRQQVLFLTGQQIAWVLCSHRISFPTKSLGNKVKVGQLDAIHGVGTWNSELRKPQFL